MSSTPVAAAKKAATQIRHQHDLTHALKVYVTETTRGSAGKEFGYKITHTRNPNPEVYISGRSKPLLLKYIVNAVSI